MKHLCSALLFLFSVPLLLDAQSFTVLTYNIRYDNPGDGDDAWPKRRDHLAGQLRFYAPDIFGIQEGLLHQLTYLDEQLPVYDRVGVGRDDGKNAGEFSALYYRTDRFKLLESGTFWLSPTPDSVSKGWDAALPRVCTWALLKDTVANQTLRVFNTHFDHIGKEARRASAALILKKMSEKSGDGYPAILIGDLNSEPSEAPTLLLNQTLTDAQSSTQEPAFGPSGTFNAFKFHEPVTRRIDYVFTSSLLRVRQYAVLSDSRDCHYPSDHLPVLAKIERK